MFDEGLEEPGRISQRLQGRDGFLCGFSGHAPRFVEGKDSHIRRLVVAQVAADGLTKHLLIADDVEDVISNLEGQAHIEGIVIEGLTLLGRGIGQDSCHFDGRLEDDARLGAVQKFHPFPADSHLTVRSQVESLTTDHARRSGCPGDEGDAAVQFFRRNLLLAGIVFGPGAGFAVGALADMIGESEAMAIRSKSLNYDYLSISSSTASLLKVLMIGAFPLAYLGIGVGVVLTRRRKQNEAV